MTTDTPESIRFYLENKAVLDHIDKMDGIPKTLTIEEVRQLHLAKLALLMAKTDYWCWLLSLFDSVWASSVAAFKGERLPLDDSAWGRVPFVEVERAWKGGELYIAYRFQDKGKFWLGVDFWPAGYPLTLWLAAIGEDGQTRSLPKPLTLPWSPYRPTDSWWKAAVSSQASVDPDKLAAASKLADGALSVLLAA